MDLGGTLRDPKFDLNWPFWTPLRVLGRLLLDPQQAAFGLEDLLRASQTHAWDLKFCHFDHFSYWKSQFCHFAYQGSVKMPFWPYFDPILSPPELNFLALAKMCLFAPFGPDGPWGTLRDPKFDLNWPFWTPLRVLREAAARPCTSCLLGWRTCSEPQNPCPGPQFWSFWPLFDLILGPKQGPRGSRA